MLKLANKITLTSLLSLLFIKLLTNNNNLDNNILYYDRLILFIASLQYLFTSNINNKIKIQKLRYLDWFLTTPLLLLTFWSIAKRFGWNRSFINLLIPNMLMIISGYQAEFSNNKFLFYIISILSLLFIFYEIRKITKFLYIVGFDTRGLQYFFYLGWSFYGLNFINKDYYSQQIFYSLLDLINKVVYSIYLQIVINYNKKLL